MNKVEPREKHLSPKSSRYQKISVNLSDAAGRDIRLSGRSCAALSARRAAAGPKPYSLTSPYIAFWHLAWIMHWAFSSLLFALLLILQSETKISGCKNYILMLLIAVALPSFEAKIKSCCDFFKCRPTLQISRRHWVLINLNHRWVQSIVHNGPLPVCVKRLMGVLWFCADCCLSDAITRLKSSCHMTHKT